MDEALIVVSLISTFGMMATVQLIQHNWYKKTNHKFKLDQIKKVDTIQLKKLEKDLLGTKIRASSVKSSAPSNLGLGNIGEIINLAKEYPDLAHNILDRAIEGDVDFEGGEGLLEMAKPLIDGFLKAKNEGGEAKDNIVYEG